MGKRRRTETQMTGGVEAVTGEEKNHEKVVIEEHSVKAMVVTKAQRSRDNAC